MLLLSVYQNICSISNVPFVSVNCKIKDSNAQTEEKSKTPILQVEQAGLVPQV